MAREKEVFLCGLAEQAGRFNDVVKSMKKVCEIDADLSQDERNSLSLGYKNMVGACRASWRILHAIELKKEEKGELEHLEIIREYRQKVAAEQELICRDCINVIDTYLIPTSRNSEATVFYNKMKGDYYRYLAEIIVGDERINIVNESMKAYLAAEGVARTDLATTDPTRLGVALNFSVFHYEIRRDATKACEVAKKAFDDAEAELDGVSEDTYKDSTAIMQLLRDNLNLWHPNEDYVLLGG